MTAQLNADAVLLTQALRDSATMSGWLVKEGANYKTWRKRMCILTDHRLFYVKDSLTRGVLLLDAETVFRNIDGPARRPFMFSLEPTLSFSDGKQWHKRTYFFAASSADERSEWQTAVQSAVRSSTSHAQPSLSLSSTASLRTFGSSGSLPSVAEIHTDAAPHPPNVSTPEQNISSSPHQARFTPPAAPSSVPSSSSASPSTSTSLSVVGPSSSFSTSSSSLSSNSSSTLVLPLPKLLDQEIILLVVDKSPGFIHGFLHGVCPLVAVDSKIYVPSGHVNSTASPCIATYELDAVCATISALAGTSLSVVIALPDDSAASILRNQVIMQCAAVDNVNLLVSIQPISSSSSSSSSTSFSFSTSASSIAGADTMTKIQVNRRAFFSELSDQQTAANNERACLAICDEDAGCIVAKSLIHFMLGSEPSFPVAVLQGPPTPINNTDDENRASDSANRMHQDNDAVDGQILKKQEDILGQQLQTLAQHRAVEAFRALTDENVVKKPPPRVLFDRIPPEIGTHVINRLLDCGVFLRVVLPKDESLPASLNHPNLETLHDDDGLEAAFADISFLVVHNPFPSDDVAFQRMLAVLQHVQQQSGGATIAQAFLLSCTIAAHQAEEDNALLRRAVQIERTFTTECTAPTTIIRTGLLSENIVDFFANALVLPPHALVLPVNGDQLFSVVAAADVGVDVSNIIVHSPASFAGRTITLAGREALSFNRIAELLSDHASEFFLYRGPQPDVESARVSFFSCESGEYAISLRLTAVQPLIAQGLVDFFRILESRGADYSPPLQCHDRPLQTFSLFVESTLLRLLSTQPDQT